MSKPEIVVRAALTIGGPSVYHEIRGNVEFFSDPPDALRTKFRGFLGEAYRTVRRMLAERHHEDNQGVPVFLLRESLIFSSELC
jgi:hypothetical protein